MTQTVNKIMSVKVPVALADDFKKIAKEKYTSTSSEIRRLMSEAIKEHKLGKPHD